MIPGQRIKETPHQYATRVFNAGMEYAAKIADERQKYLDGAGEAADAIRSAKLPGEMEVDNG